MSKKILLTSVLFFIFTMSIFSQSPLSFYNGDGYWKETAKYCFVDGIRLHYWLFSSQKDGSYSMKNGSVVVADDQELHNAALSYAESIGWTRDYSKNVSGFFPNASLAISVKNMMRENGAMISMTIIEDGTNTAILIVNTYSWGLEKRVNDNLSLAGSDIYPLIK